MRKPLLVCIGLGLLGSAAPASAHPGVVRFGPFDAASPDGGTCGNAWAQDTFERSFRAAPHPDDSGAFVVVERFRHGRFVTVAGPSPGGCQTNPGGTVADGVRGRFHGVTVMLVHGDLDRDAVCTDETCGTRAGFVTTVFGAGATFTIPTFFFQYTAGRNGVWINASDNLGGNRGDITGAPRHGHRDDGDDDDDDDDDDD